MLGAGSFGVVREAIELTTGRKFACKTIPKVPKRGKPTPRYLLKLQQEVDAMQQIGASFDAVYLKVRTRRMAQGFVLRSLRSGQPVRAAGQGLREAAVGNRPGAWRHGQRRRCIRCRVHVLVQWGLGRA